MGWPSSLSLLLGQIRYQLLMIRRIPVALFFTLALPLIMLVLFNALFGDSTVDTQGGGEWPVRQFYTGGLAVFTAVSATYTNLANLIPIRRDEGVLKRWRGTPLPTWAYIGGMVGSALVLAIIGAAIMIGLGVVVYDLQIEAAKMPIAVLNFVIGICSFAAMGMAVAALVPNGPSASAVANATLLPVAFFSNVFIVTEGAPGWIDAVGDFFPLKPFVENIQDAFNPFVDAPAFDWYRTYYVALWGVAGLFVAWKFFKWEPRRGAAPRRRRSAAAPVDDD